MSAALPRRILLGVTGGIAAYKSALLVRALVKAGAEVQVVMTPAAHDFVTPLTLSTLSGRPVLTDLFVRDGSGRWNDHVHLARWADALLVAPASANTLAKMAHGQCDNLLLACFLSATCPVFVAPAMDLEMWRDPATGHNLTLLKERGVRAIGPSHGELASGLVGEGRMTEPDELVHALQEALIGASPWAGRTVLVTAGPTQEPIDPVRYIGNRSSGRMGFAIAEEAARRGARVQLVTGPVQLTAAAAGIVRTDVGTAAEMAEACKAIAPQADVVVMSAAVADFRPAAPATRKVKKGEPLDTLALEPTEDILAWIGAHRRPGQLIVGFALETNDGVAHARGKLQRKGLDLVVMNTLEDAGAGFGHPTNRVTFIAPDTDPQPLPLMSKSDVARALLDRLEALL
ncbi:MAG: bifunctional phosphopantothenoylcysteine decarboxylase/phosphopantothenate--cysteine ligase CoaBC [Flavobacteriales bacterium]|nr:bifunctional phosphopantothenoylcysteine decarboxylase/phosphopantothenate--cysteine ligase CoaBC [Flavobacteriales bacterium]MBK7941513.1 bifunctional phosphopantothenoylcysteine decarboxylase/phosphopantothenate--cysteine ligase CoaBC [Flavobacteriales bacterium]MBK8949893.1 bifunctional phosphopantothenoylcysteine decarboxylase/phosphopantothenate--cysteine ligase CoaBC [Flavobacteriales bacterium]MBK9701395.1 bifunctional phosphopantothenoylcysteine decarboxylase/phosphopantothenate--cyst